MAENGAKHAAPPRPPSRRWKIALSLGVVLVFASAIAVLAVHQDIGQPVAQHAPGDTGSPPAAVSPEGQPTSESPSTSPSASPSPSPSSSPKPSRTRSPSPAGSSGNPTPQATDVPAGPSGVAMPTGDLRGWQMVLADDFNGSSLNTSSWGAYHGQPGGDPGGCWDPSHVVVQGGILNLLSYQDLAAKAAEGCSSAWVSGGVSSAHALKQAFGKYEVRFRIDAGDGIGYSVLLWPSDEHWPPEIDFAEDGGGNRSQINATLHYGANDNQISRTWKVDMTQWHTLGVEWTPGRLVYTLDGNEWGQTSTSQVPAQLMELDIQTQAGTCGQIDTPCPDAGTPQHVVMQVDWVVAYRPV